MAHHAPIPVQCQGHVAVRASDGLAAGTAGHKIGIAPAVDKQHDLLPFSSRFLYISALKAPAEK